MTTALAPARVPPQRVAEVAHARLPTPAGIGEAIEAYRDESRRRYGRPD